MKKFYFLSFGLLLFTLQLNAQSVRNVRATINGNDVIISYDLNTPTRGQKFDITIKSSKDGFSNPLLKVSGDIGPEQIAGNGKKIIWEAKEEIGIFKGVVSFEITATVTFTPIQFLQPVADTQVKMGKPYTLKWKGGTLNSDLRLELLKNNSQIMEMGSITNTGSYIWTVPKTMQKGENYQFKLLDPTRPNDAVLSIGFNIKKKPSPLVIIIPIAAVLGVGAAVLLGGGDPPPPDVPIPVETQSVPELPTNIHPGGG